MKWWCFCIPFSLIFSMISVTRQWRLITSVSFSQDFILITLKAVHYNNLKQYAVETMPHICMTLRVAQVTVAFRTELRLSWGFTYMVSISLGFPYMIMLQTFKRKRHCSLCCVAMGCYVRRIITEAAIVTSQCYGRFCFTEYAQTWAKSAPKCHNTQ